MKFFKILSICVLLSIVIACNEKKKNIIETKTVVKEIENLSQTRVLNEKKENFNNKADDITKRVYQEGLDAVIESGILQSAKNVGDIAPSFSLKNAVGQTVNLKDYLAKGPVVLVWYRGGWCPYCNINLQYLQQELPKFKAAGANLIALTPELPDQSINTSDKHNLEFEVLSDVGNEIAKAYGVVFKLTAEVAEIYNKKFDLNTHNGDTTNELPLAATYIINTNGKIEYAFLDADYRNRAEPSEITAFLKKM
ncbi:peroxiredoxin-like family protein [Neotamlana sedimentorum]|uniref:peroxiredoxin-like family protein n=1 Tax=Neotamlana sedimentorum TaxID=1435349 RepID=UPI0009E2050C|nr:peroxiredoxin-like family protein [Tamlana sedimentorum]